jgi:hypothetical protein
VCLYIASNKPTNSLASLPEFDEKKMAEHAMAVLMRSLKKEMESKDIIRDCADIEDVLYGIDHSTYRLFHFHNHYPCGLLDMLQKAIASRYAKKQATGALVALAKSVDPCHRRAAVNALIELGKDGDFNESLCIRKKSRLTLPQVAHLSPILLPLYERLLVYWHLTFHQETTTTLPLCLSQS